MNPKRQQATPAPKNERGTKRPTPGVPGLGDLLGRLKEELLALAAQAGLKGVSKLSKAELARRVHEARSASTPAEPAHAAKGAAEPGAAPGAEPARSRRAEGKPKVVRGAAPPPKASPPTANAAAEAKPAAPAAKRVPEPKAPPPAKAPTAVAKAPATAARIPDPGAVAPVNAPMPARDAPAEVPTAAGATAEPPAGGAVPEERPSPAATARLDLGRPSPAGHREEHIPWSYGQDRVTAMAIDPGNLYVYWEVSDLAIDRARAALGAAGEGAWLNLRVYDITGILFDGANAHSWFDHGLGRSDRQWFFSINKPSSSVVVEIGLRAADGGFARVARSSRVDFPRNEPAPWTEPEWMTVLASGEQYGAGRGAPARGDGQAHGGGAGAGGGMVGGERVEHVPIWILLEPGEGERRFRELFGEQFERIEWQSGGGEGWYEFQGRLEWQVGPVMTSWEEGPFAYPVQVDPPARAAWEGGAIAYSQGGVTRVVYGPWAVVIRNMHGRTQHAVVGRWQIFRSWATRGGVEELQRYTMRMAGAPGGGSERTAASAWLWQSGSELRLGGASELWRLGASEVRLRGASEVFYAGASERRMMGASERRLAGASEWRLAGASERRLGGASERMRQGASEWRLGGASERRLIGASERRLGGSEQRLGGASEERLGGASEQRLGGAKEERPSAAAPAEDDDWDWQPPGDLSAPGRE